MIDVAAGDKIPRKGGPGITKSDLLVINKIDLAPMVGASLEVMERDAKKMRGERPFVFTNLKTGPASTPWSTSSRAGDARGVTAPVPARRDRLPSRRIGAEFVANNLRDRGRDTMDPREVGSAQDVRWGWDDWEPDERLDALGALANSNLDDYDYEGVDVYNDGDPGDAFPGSTDEAGIHIDQSLLEGDADTAIHVTDHETVHCMDDQDGIDSSVGPSSYPDGYVFTEEELDSMMNHIDVGDQAKVLDDDGYIDRDAPRSGSSGAGGGGPSPGGGFDGSGDGSGSPAPSTDEISFEIDWASGVWVDSTSADGSYEVSIDFAPMEGW